MLLANQRTKEDPRITRTRALLITALGELMREKNFEAITVSEIAQRATLNRVTFYAHFQDKYDLLEAATRDMIRQQIDAALSQRNPFSEAKLGSLLRMVCSFLTEFVGHCPPPHRQLEPLIEKQIKSEIYEVILGWLINTPSNDKNDKAALEQTATVTTWSMYGAAVQWSQKANRESVDEFIKQVLPLILSNLTTLTNEKTKPNRVKRTAGGSCAYELLRQSQLSYFN